MFIFLPVFLFILGTAFGSFANVLVDRIPKNKSIGGRSHCDYCKKELKPQDLIPMISFLFLKGRCRYCSKRLSPQYFFVEFLTGFLFVATYFLTVNFLTLYALPYSITITFIFWLIFLIDLKEGIIPTVLVWVGVLLTLANYLFYALYNAYKIYNVYISSGEFGQYLAQTDFFANRLIMLARPIVAALLAGLILSGFFAFLVWITKGRGMGGGDVRLGFLIGFMLGPSATLSAFFIAFLTGSFVATILLLMKRKTFGQTVPFGPFLSASAWISLFFGQQIWNWYLTTL